jgi:hypothetical protein
MFCGFGILEMISDRRLDVVLVLDQTCLLERSNRPPLKVFKTPLIFQNPLPNLYVCFLIDCGVELDVYRNYTRRKEK